ncbi:phytanoyl-CoA dioxygenase [Aurantiacibacter xanthus]|uniref:Phytanoyl-CoA dioxygenase n=1 Tax=Aurantiacibacter xanthus TaxID=1784712 RepID=A0A3A1NZG5_9SPHN|nr:phytanoyl-CoA dioxygenase [Aurantiacibacter xanthus]
MFPGVPLIESPIFDSEELSGFTEHEKQIARQLNTDGFAVLDFPDPEIDARIERIKRNLGPGFDIPLDDPAADKTKGERRIQDAWKTDKDVHAIASNPAMLDLLSKLYGRRAFPFQTLNFPVGTQQSAHADSVHFSSLPERFMCGVWLAMEDISATAGPLFYVRGSHRWPIVSNAMIGRRGYGSVSHSAQAPYAEAWAAMCETYDKVEEPFLARKGQALIWCANLLHGGSRQTDPKLTRWSQVTHYFFDDCIYYTPAFSDETLGQLALRNLVSIEDQSPKPNTYLGEPVAAAKPAKRGRLSKLFGKRG